MPLTTDLSRGELVTYQGRNPRPQDFEAFWTDAISAAQAFKPEIVFKPAYFQTPFAQCFDMTYTSLDNSKIHAKVLHPINAPSQHPAIIMFHGLGWYSGDWSSKLAYVAQGFSVIAMDCRGQGIGSGDTSDSCEDTILGHVVRGLRSGPHAMLYKKMFIDALILSYCVMDMPGIDPNRIGVTGMSQGGALTLVCAALNPKIARVAPVFPFLCDFKRAWEIGNAAECYTEIHNYFRKYDPLHEFEDSFFETLGYIDVQFFCPRIAGSVLAGCGLMDTTCPPSTQFAAFNKIVAPKEILLYPEYKHEELIGHNDKIFEFLSKL